MLDKLMQGGSVPTVAELLILLAAVAGSGSMVGFLGWLLYRVRRLEARSRARNGQLEQLIEAVDELRDQLMTVRDETGELQERVDFAERLMTRDQAVDAPNRQLPPP